MWQSAIAREHTRARPGVLPAVLQNWLIHLGFPLRSLNIAFGFSSSFFKVTEGSGLLMRRAGAPDSLESLSKSELAS